MGAVMKRPTHTQVLPSHRNACKVTKSPIAIAINTGIQMGSQTHMEKDIPTDTGI